MQYNKEKLQKALEAYKKGQMIIVIDDDKRESEGDLVIAGQHCTTEHMAFMIRYTSGIICAPMESHIADFLELPPMVEDNRSAYETAFTISVDYKNDTTTGISAYERALCIRNLTSVYSVAEDFIRPGHVFPLIAKAGGILKRCGHTEAAVDLCHMTDLYPVAAIGELMNDDGTVKKGKEIEDFAKEHQLYIVTIEDLMSYRIENGQLVCCLSQYENITLQGYRSKTKTYHVAGSDKSYYVYIEGYGENLTKVKLSILKENIYEFNKIKLEKGEIALSIFVDCEVANKDTNTTETRRLRWLGYESVMHILQDMQIKECEISSDIDENYIKSLTKYGIKIMKR